MGELGRPLAAVTWRRRCRSSSASSAPPSRRARPRRCTGPRTSAQPSLIRVEADEVTYNLHIVLRFELELALIEGSLEPADLPEAWAEANRASARLEIPDHRTA